MGLLREDRRMEDTDEGEVAVALPVIQAIADYERIRYVKASIFDRHLHLTVCPFVKENTDVHVRWMVRYEVVPEVFEAEARIDDVFDNQHVLVGDAFGQILEEWTRPDDT
jgi:hypothetical protein